MRRVFDTILGTLAGFLLLLALGAQVLLHWGVAGSAFADRVNRDIEQLFATVDSVAPLPENEGKPVRVCGEAEIVAAEMPEQVDELLGVRVKAIALSRGMKARNESGDLEYVDEVVLPGGLEVKSRELFSPAKLECRLGGFTYRDTWPEEQTWSFAPYCHQRRWLGRDEMNPVPGVLQGAEWVEKDHCWSYMDGKVTVCASCDEPVLGDGNAAAVYGMQRGDRIVPYPYSMPRAWSLYALCRCLAGEPLPRQVDVLLVYEVQMDPGCPAEVRGSGDVLDRLLRASVGGACGRLVPMGDATLRDLGELAGLAVIVLGTLLAMVLLAVELRFCLRRRVWPCMLYVGGGMLLLTLLNYWNAHWIW